MTFLCVGELERRWLGAKGRGVREWMAIALYKIKRTLTLFSTHRLESGWPGVCRGFRVWVARC